MNQELNVKETKRKTALSGGILSGDKSIKVLSNKKVLIDQKVKGGAVETQGQKTGKVTAVDKVTTMKGEDTLTSCICEEFLAGEV